jgi:hypothetical protein
VQGLFRMHRLLSTFELLFHHKDQVLQKKLMHLKYL